MSTFHFIDLLYLDFSLLFPFAYLNDLGICDPKSSSISSIEHSFVAPACDNHPLHKAHLYFILHSYFISLRLDGVGEDNNSIQIMLCKVFRAGPDM